MSSDGGRLSSLTSSIDDVELEEYSSVDEAFQLFCTVLVLLMQAGFALYEAGSIARTSPEVILIKNVTDSAVAYLCWFAFGYAFAHGPGSFVGTQGFFLRGDDFVEVGGDTRSLSLIHFLFTGSFAACAVTIMSGAVADRVSYPFYLIYAVVTCVFVYSVVAHAVWAPDGFLSAEKQGIANCGALDFAGSGVVHTFAGTASLAWAILLKPRNGRVCRNADGKVDRIEFRGQQGFEARDTTAQATGVFLLWVGWYGFNCGSAGLISTADTRELVATAAVNTTIAPAVACVISVILGRYYRVDLFGVQSLFPAVGDGGGEDRFESAINGILAGLVSITAGAATTEPRATIGIAAFGALIYHFTFRMQLQCGIDDCVNAAPVHMYCGMWGMLAASFAFTDDLVDKLRPGDVSACDLDQQVGANLVAIAFIVAWALVWYVGLYFMLKVIPGSDLHLQKEGRKYDAHGRDLQIQKLEDVKEQVKKLERFCYGNIPPTVKNGGDKRGLLGNAPAKVHATDNDDIESKEPEFV